MRRRKVKRRRNRAFTPAEESFFAAGDRLADEAPAPAESFDDLDDGRGPGSFWERLVRTPETA